MIKCPECGAEVTEQMRFCPHCGKPLQANSTTPEKEWFYIFEGQQQGPISEPSLIELFESNQLTPETLVWSQCFHRWVKARNIGGMVSPSDYSKVSEKKETSESQEDNEAKQWFYFFGGHNHGPVSEAALIKLFKSDQITPDTLVWTKNSNKWTKARDVEGLVPSAKMRMVVNIILIIVFVPFCVVIFTVFAQGFVQLISTSFGGAAAGLVVLIFAVFVLIYGLISIFKRQNTD